MNARRWAATCLAAAMLTIQAPALAAEAPLKTVEVHVDPRIELASTILALTPWAKDNGDLATSAYAAEAQAAFAKHTRHPAVFAVNEWLNSEQGDMGALVRLALVLNSDLAGSSSAPMDLAGEFGGTEQAERLLGLMGQFATDTSFMTFFQAHATTYSKLEAQIGPALMKANPAGRLEGYFGTGFDRYQVLLAPLAPKVGYSWAIASEPTGVPTVVVRAEGVTKDKQPDFKETSLDFTRAVRQGLGRAFVAPLGAKYALDLSQSAGLMTPIADDMKANQCGDWQEAFDEHLVRAIDARFMQEDGAGKEAQLALRSNERAGFAYIRGMFDQLADYETNRKGYANMDVFVPNIVAKLSYLKDTGADQDVAKRSSTFQGPLGRAFDKRYLSSTVIVRPTPTDPKLKAALTAYVQTVKETFKKRYHKDAVVVSPEEAARLNPAETSYLILGTPWSNPFLAALIKYIPLKVTKNNIALGGKQFLGSGLRLATAFPNPYNPKLPMQILTSTEDSGIQGIFTLPVGPYDYAVFHGDQAIAQGDYVYDLKGKWSVP
ncbi:MAG TPA: DUF4932 domain-containing protein [Stenomitos sp.]